MSYELIGSHVLDAVCDKLDEMESYINSTICNADNRAYFKSEHKTIKHLIKFGRVSCDVQPMPKIIDDNHPEEEEYQPCEEEIHAFEGC